MKLARFTAPLWDLDTFYFFRDFENFTTATDGLTSQTDLGPPASTVAAGDGAGGVVVLTTGALDNNEAAIRSTNELWLAANDKPLYARAALQYTEAAVNAANVFFGFASAAGADLLLDNGGGPRASGSIIGIYKVDGGTVWRAQSRNGTTVQDSISTTTAGGVAYQTLEVEVADYDGVTASVTYRVDGQLLKDSQGTIIRHTFPYVGATEMNLVAYAKAGTAVSQAVNVDFVYGSARR